MSAIIKVRPSHYRHLAIQLPLGMARDVGGVRKVLHIYNGVISCTDDTSIAAQLLILLGPLQLASACHISQSHRPTPQLVCLLAGCKLYFMEQAND